MESAIELKNVYKNYPLEAGKVQVLKNISLSLPQGKMIALCGPSGSGKTTLLKVLGLLELPSSGSLVFDSNTITENSDQSDLIKLRQSKLGFVFQNFELLSYLTLLENVALPLQVKGVSANVSYEKAETLLAKVGLQDRLNFFPSQVSGGQMQRAAIARALIHSPRLILADEPTGNLDSENGMKIIELLRSCLDIDVSIVVATHSSEVREYCDLCVQIKDGAVSDSLILNDISI